MRQAWNIWKVQWLLREKCWEDTQIFFSLMSESFSFDFYVFPFLLFYWFSNFLGFDDPFKFQFFPLKPSKSILTWRTLINVDCHFRGKSTNNFWWGKHDRLCRKIWPKPSKNIFHNEIVIKRTFFIWNFFTISRSYFKTKLKVDKFLEIFLTFSKI